MKHAFEKLKLKGLISSYNCRFLLSIEVCLSGSMSFQFAFMYNLLFFIVYSVYIAYFLLTQAF